MFDPVLMNWMSGRPSTGGKVGMSPKPPSTNPKLETLPRPPAGRLRFAALRRNTPRASLTMLLPKMRVLLMVSSCERERVLPPKPGIFSKLGLVYGSNTLASSKK